ncbi:MAG: DUF1640 domain-containing protein [Magnetococcales bacterium]|nr:DUF1640 domain-containing protein [Magnetococcales bacterium]
MNAAVAFDTLKFVKTLKAAGVEEKQAEAFSEAIRDVQDSQLKELATKGDLRELETRIMAEINLVKWMLAVVVAATVLPALKSLLVG